MLNDVISILLGFVALVLPLFAFLQKEAYKRSMLCLASTSLCGVSLLLQLFILKKAIALEQYTDVIDTINGRFFAAVVLLLLVIILNFVAIKRKQQNL